MDGKLAAVTGLQKKSISDNPMKVAEVLKGVLLDKEDKSMRYLQSRLRSGREIYETGYHVCEILQERDFNMLSDNRRMFNKFKNLGGFHDSEPYENVKQCDLNRFVSGLGRVVKYQRSVSLDIPADVKKHSGYLDTAVRKFVRCLFVNEFNLYYKGMFCNYRQLLQYIYVVVTGEGYINEVKMDNALVSGDKFSLSVNNISTLKRRPLKHGPLKSYRPDVKIFIDNVKRSKMFPDFDIDGFLHKSMKNDAVNMTDIGSDNHNRGKLLMNIKLSLTNTASKNVESGKRGVGRVRFNTFYKELEVDVDKLK